MHEYWYTCFKKEAGSTQVDCIGPFLNALEADLNTPKKCIQSRLVPVCKYMPKVLRQFVVSVKCRPIFVAFHWVPSKV